MIEYSSTRACATIQPLDADARQRCTSVGAHPQHIPASAGRECLHRCVCSRAALCRELESFQVRRLLARLWTRDMIM